MVTYDDIKNALKNIIPMNCPVLVHSSLKSFGYVDGGADTVINALLSVCGGNGTVVVPTLSFNFVDESNPYFSVHETPSSCGIVTETLRKRPGAHRSQHVFSSAAAMGADAQYLTEWHDDTPCGPRTPYMKIIEMSGYSLFLGALMSTNSLFHCAEEAVNPEYMRYKTIFNVKVKDSNDTTHIRNYKRYDCAQTGIVRRLDRMEKIFRDNGAIKDLKIGDSHVMLISAEDNFKLSCNLLKNDPGYILENNIPVKI